MKNEHEQEYIIVQAGGKGTRMKEYTKNKPKALVPIDNLPMIFHLFRKYPDKKFIIIADYKADILRKYLRTFAKVRYVIVDASGNIGTCAGIRDALTYIPENSSFILIWSDLLFADEFEFPDTDYDYVGLSRDFECRWSYVDGKFIEKASKERGVAGFFSLMNKEVLSDVPMEGEFVAWLAKKNLPFHEIVMKGTKEYGLYQYIEKTQPGKCRPFNRLTYEGDEIIKEPIDAQGRELAKKEVCWYKKAICLGVENIPDIYSYSPIRMKKIDGNNPYTLEITKEEKQRVVDNIVYALKELHEKEKCNTDYFSINEAYFKKTIDRLNRVRDLIPGSNLDSINVNGRRCRNIYFHINEFEKRIGQYRCDNFSFIHGDCTFSNIVTDNNLKPYLIDPRGYFGNTKIYGDENYDWSKLYYSIVGNYDRFNIGDFSLDIEEDGSEINLQIESSGYEELGNYMLELANVKSEDIKLIHSLIWLSLTTYAWENYDSICAAFYNGLYYMEEVL